MMLLLTSQPLWMAAILLGLVTLLRWALRF
jgi:hypothetical protein